MRNIRAVEFYDLIDSWTSFGIEDFTEGIYDAQVDRDYHVAQRAQHDYLLDEVRCKKGSFVMDVGCGNGTLLEVARARGATGVGLTISQVQVDRCDAKGLIVYLKDYRDLGSTWLNLCTGVIANGSLEHFVTPQDAIRGKQDEIYREMFQKIRMILKREGKFATTAIHFNRVPNPDDVLKNPFSYRWGSDNFHYSFVLGNLGCYYPTQGQLERCAEGIFTLEKEVDGTGDYRITSEYWLNRLWPSALLSKSFWKNLLNKSEGRKAHTASSLFQYTIPQSWNWQFRPDKNGQTPTKLLRQTWKMVK